MRKKSKPEWNHPNGYALVAHFYYGTVPSFVTVWHEPNFKKAYARWNAERQHLVYTLNGRSVKEYSFGVV